MNWNDDDDDDDSSRTALKPRAVSVIWRAWLGGLWGWASRSPPPHIACALERERERERDHIVRLPSCLVD